MSIYRGPLIIGDIPQLDVVVPTFNVTEIFTGGTYDTSVFTLSGSYRIDTSDKFEGTHSWRSGETDHSSTSNSYLKFQGTSTDKLRFYYRVSSESNYDKLTVRVNGVVIVNSISGELGWAQTGLIDLVNGENTIHMQYSKDSSVSRGTDSGYIDKIQIFK